MTCAIDRARTANRQGYRRSGIPRPATAQRMSAAIPKIPVDNHPVGRQILENPLTLSRGDQHQFSRFSPVWRPLSKVDQKRRSPAEPVCAGQRAIRIPYSRVELRGLEPLTLTLPV
jgi:hypothetical protein